jgi:1-deoxy-D-xylulose-5-phosphate synthase
MGIDARVINARFAKPLDTDFLDRLAQEEIPIVTVEEACIAGGFGSAILEYYMQKEKHNLRIKLLGVPDYYVEHGSIQDQLAEVGLTPERIADTVNAFIAQKIQSMRVSSGEGTD